MLITNGKFMFTSDQTHIKYRISFEMCSIDDCHINTIKQEISHAYEKMYSSENEHVMRIVVVGKFDENWK